MGSSIHRAPLESLDLALPLPHDGHVHERDVRVEEQRRLQPERLALSNELPPQSAVDDLGQDDRDEGVIAKRELLEVYPQRSRDVPFSSPKGYEPPEPRCRPGPSFAGVLETAAGVERAARERYGMIKPGEKVYIIPDEKQTE